MSGRLLDYLENDLFQALENLRWAEVEVAECRRRIREYEALLPNVKVDQGPTADVVELSARRGED